MGYNTTYRGELKIEATLTGLKRLKSILGEDVRNHPDFAKHKGRHDPKDAYWHHVDLVLNDEFNLEWDDGAEKSYICPDMIVAIVNYVREVDPTFKITGTFDAYGEEPGDIWKLVCTGGSARRADPEAERKRLEGIYNDLLGAVDAVLDYFEETNQTTGVRTRLAQAAAEFKKAVADQ